MSAPVTYRGGCNKPAGHKIYRRAVKPSMILVRKKVSSVAVPLANFPGSETHVCVSSVLHKGILVCEPPLP